MTVGGTELLRGQRRRHAARLPQRVRLVPDAARRRADDAGRRRSPARRASGASSCAAPGRSPDDDALQIAPVPLLRERGARPGGGRLMDPALVAGLRRFVREPSGAPRPPPAERPRAASCARCRWPRTTSTCSTSRSGGSSASARPAGRCAPARRATGRRARARCGSSRSSSPTSCGRRSRSRSASRSSCARPPRGRSSASTRARRGPPSASSTSRPGTGSWPRTPCSRTSTPTPRR